jgi:hypothetical protein
MKHDMKGNKKEPQNRSEQGLNQKEQPLGVRASGVLLLSFIGVEFGIHKLSVREPWVLAVGRPDRNCPARRVSLDIDPGGSSR